MIRRAVKENIPLINDIVKEYNPSFMHQYSLDLYLDSDIYLIYVYEEDNTIKGFIICNHLYERVEILLLFVDTKYRNLGVGKSLIEYLYNLDAEIISLEVSVENKPALHLYQKLGFKQIGIRKKYYQGIDALIMERRIK